MQISVAHSALILAPKQEKMLVEYDNARVLITDQKLETIKDILPLLEQVTRVNQPLLIIAEDVVGVYPLPMHFCACIFHEEATIHSA